MRRHWKDWVLALLTVGALIRLFRVGWTYNADLHVYWDAARHILEGSSPYAFTAVDRGFVIKYPPWTMPFFLPLGYMSWEVARVSWYLMEVGCVAYIIRWMVGHGVGRHLAWGVAFLFWWMWQAHFSAGQIFLPLTVAVLAMVPPSRAGEETATWRAVGGAFLLSAKVYPLVIMAGAWRVLLRPKFWLWSLSAFVVAHGVYWAASHGYPLKTLYHEWVRAATSSGAELGEYTVRGPANHGFPALILRLLGVNPLITWPDTLASFGSALGLGALWWSFSRPLTRAQQWSGWVAIGAVAHPLAWQHGFVMVYPLCCFAVAEALRSSRRVWIVASLVAIAMVGLIIPPIFGSPMVEPLELLGIKIWGVCLAAAVLIRLKVSIRS